MSKFAIVQLGTGQLGEKFLTKAGAEYTLAADDAANFNALTLGLRANGKGGPFTYPLPNEIDSAANPLVLAAAGMVKFRAATGETEVVDLALVFSQGTLTIDAAAVATNTMTIGSTVYTFQAGAVSAAGEIQLNASVPIQKANILAAIRGTDGFNVAHPDITIGEFAGDDAILTATIGGTVGDAIVTTETFTPAGNIFDAATLGTTTAGVNGVTAVNLCLTQSLDSDDEEN